MNKAKKIALGSVLLTSLSGGYYQLIGGNTDQAVGVVGSYQVGGPSVQTLRYANPKSFEIGIKKSLLTSPDMRRIEFICGDGSKSFTVYINPVKIIGIPEESVVCDDGYPLLAYPELTKGGYVSQTPEWVGREKEN